MKRKIKLALIDSYVNIFRLLYRCKINLIFAKSESEILMIDNFTKKLLLLKDQHEDFFKENSMYNNSLILLKKQLNDSLCMQIIPSTLPQTSSFTEKIIQTENNFYFLKNRFYFRKKKKKEIS